MTIEKYVLEYCTSRGMWPKQAQSVLEVMKLEERDYAIGSWLDQIEDYPEPMQAMMALACKGTALEWIEANCPRAFFKPLFMTEEQRVTAGYPPNMFEKS